MHSAEAKVAAASTTKIPRQESRVNATASGAVDSKAPMPPATIIQLASDACRSFEYQVAIALSGAMRQTRDARADQRARECESGKIVAGRERQRAATCDRQQDRLDSPRAVPVEQHPGRNLHCRKRDEVRAGQQTERRRADT